MHVKMRSIALVPGTSQHSSVCPAALAVPRALGQLGRLAPGRRRQREPDVQIGALLACGENTALRRADVEAVWKQIPVGFIKTVLQLHALF